MKKIFNIKDAKSFEVSYIDSLGFYCTCEIKKIEFKELRKHVRNFKVFKINF